MKKTIGFTVESAKQIMSSLFKLENSVWGASSCNLGNIYESKPPLEIQNQLVEICGEYKGIDKVVGTITLQTEEGKIALMPVKETVYSKSIIGSKIVVGERLYSIALKVDEPGVFVPATIIRDKEKELFLMINSIFGRTNAIKDFYRLDPSKQEYIIRQLREGRYKRFDQNDDATFESRHEQRLKYAMTKETYTPDTQRTIEYMFRDSCGSKHKVEQRQQYISRIAPGYDKRTPIDSKKISKKLDEHFYKMDKAKIQIVDLLVSNERADKRGCNILFVGPPGVGKTSLTKAIAEMTNLPYESISMNGLSCPLEIEGLDPGYDSSDAGSIIKAFAAHGTSEMIIILDEFDKINRNSKEGDAMNVFLKIFLGEHYDKYLQCTVNTENTIFIATANSTDNIPEAIMNRFNAVIFLDEYSCEEKLEIAKRFIIPEVMQNYRIDGNKVTFTDDAIITIISRYCEDDGARDLKHNIEKIIRRIISSDKADENLCITAQYIEDVLSVLTEETPALYFSRNRDSYSEPVSREIKKCIQASKITPSDDADRFQTDKKRQKLSYLLACKEEKETIFEKYDPKAIAKTLHDELYGMEPVIKEINNLYYSAYLQGKNNNSNLALCGGPGIGKTTVVNVIAKALGYPYINISLNGVEDTKELRGFSSSYVGSEPGRIIKGYKEAGSLKAVVQLDEIDKLKSELATVLIDMLDGEFTDNFLDVPVNLSQSIFIATANDWGKVPPVIRDRFIVIDMEGYSREEKGHIVNEYIIPKLEKKYEASGVKIEIERKAEELLLKTYANSFGIRDVEKAIQRICSGKLIEQSGLKNAKQVKISKADVYKHLGEIPIPRGNFPEGNVIPGITKALAVNNGNMGSCFAIETAIFPGKESLEITGLPKESALDSVKIAITCIKKKYPDLLTGQQIHVHFGEGSVQKDGPSAGVALYMSILSAAINKPITMGNRYDIAYTGEIGLTGGVFAVGGVIEKIQAANDSGCRKIFVPLQNYEVIKKDKLNEYNCEIIPVSHISEVVQSVFHNM